MTNDDPPKKETLRLVADNGPAREHQKNVVTKIACDQAANSLTALVSNLLRVLAGAGRPDELTRDLFKTVETWRNAYDAGNRGQMPGLQDLAIDRLFENQKEDNGPQTEDDWQRWADDPERDYESERRLLMLQLRRHIFREIASTITQSDLQIRREEQEIDRILERLNEAREQYLNGRRKTSNYRRSIAEREIEKLRRDKHTREKIAANEIASLKIKKSDAMIATLLPHHWAALQAVNSGEASAFDAIDSFAFDQLGNSGLLKRSPSGGKSKRNWLLTELGTLAISRVPPMPDLSQ